MLAISFTIDAVFFFFVGASSHPFRNDLITAVSSSTKIYHWLEHLTLQVKSHCAVRVRTNNTALFIIYVHSLQMECDVPFCNDDSLAFHTIYTRLNDENRSLLGLSK